MAHTFQTTLVTPRQQVLDHPFRYVSLPAWDGQLGVEAHRAALLVKLGYGPLRLVPEQGESRTYFVGGGFAQIGGNRLTLLADEATPADQLQREEAEAAVREAQAYEGQSPADRQKRDRDLARARGMLAMTG